MSPLVPAAAPPVDSPSVEGINRQYVVEENGQRALRDGGPRARTPEIVDVSLTLMVSRPEEIEVGEPDVPGGIDYERWSTVVQPPSRDGFADPLDFVDLFDDDE